MNVAALRASLLALGAALALHAAWADSLTFDEVEHITSGAAIWLEGDHRVGLSHPPLARMFATWPLSWMDITGFSPEWPGWREGNGWLLGRQLLFRVNDGEWLGFVSRLNIVVLFLAVCGALGWFGERCFGRAAGVAALGLAVLSPTLLAHGHLVTTDMPVLAAMLLALAAFRRLLEQVTPLRLLVTCLAVGACATTKLTGVFVAPPLFAMAGVAWWRGEPLALRIGTGSERAITSGARRAGLLAGIFLAIAGTTIALIWAVYGFRYAPAAGPGPAGVELHMNTAPTPFQQAIETQDDVWNAHLHDWQGAPREGLAFDFIRTAREYRALPEAYLLSAAFVLTYTNSGFLMGEVSGAGFPLYFPIAFAVKTPLAIFALLGLALAALVSGRARLRDPIALVGLSVLAAGVVAAALGYSKNIGHRHLLPVYPLVIVVASAAVAWASAPRQRFALAVLFASGLWLAVSVAAMRSNYLGYFNELAGGPSGGARYLLDSNLDWGQDLKRLRSWAQHEQIDRIRLGYFGGADPTRYGLPPLERLPSELPFAAPEARYEAGLYVVSATQLGGVYFPPARDGYWDGAKTRARYAALSTREATLGPEERAALARLRAGRLYVALRAREPDARIGVSLVAHRLAAPELARILAVPPGWSRPVRSSPVR